MNPLAAVSVLVAGLAWACGGSSAPLVGFWEQPGDEPRPGLAVYSDGTQIGWAFNGEIVESLAFGFDITSCADFDTAGGSVRIPTETEHFRGAQLADSGAAFTWEFERELTTAAITEAYLRRHRDVPPTTQVAADFTMIGDLHGTVLQVRWTLVFRDAATGQTLSRESKCRRLERVTSCRPFPASVGWPLSPNCS